MSKVYGTVRQQFEQNDRIDTMLNKAKGEVIAEFEKVCPSEHSLKRMVKEMHHIFDQLNKDIKQL